jgi:hypothetical protein
MLEPTCPNNSMARAQARPSKARQLASALEPGRCPREIESRNCTRHGARAKGAASKRGSRANEHRARGRRPTQGGREGQPGPPPKRLGLDMFPPATAKFISGSIAPARLQGGRAISIRHEQAQKKLIGTRSRLLARTWFHFPDSKGWRRASGRPRLSGGASDRQPRVRIFSVGFLFDGGSCQQLRLRVPPSRGYHSHAEPGTVPG